MLCRVEVCIAARAVVPPNLANLPKRTYRVMVSADFDNLGGNNARRGDSLLAGYQHAP
jgi:hypothetical protein